jgi:hypothetical protein
MEPPPGGTLWIGMSDRANHKECRRSPAWEAEAPETAPVVEAWLRRELARMYGATLDQPIPPALLRLVAARPGEAFKPDLRKTAHRRA